MNTATPWVRWMQIGLGGMGLVPSSFWSLSLREWSLALEGWMERYGMSATTPLTRRELEHLVAVDRKRPKA